jgi:hypothetical protein
MVNLESLYFLPEAVIGVRGKGGVKSNFLANSNVSCVEVILGT